MTETSLDDGAMWFSIIGVIVVVLGVVLSVSNHAIDKPGSPQELVVAAFMQKGWEFQVKELNTRIGLQPLLLTTPDKNQLKWRPLFYCITDGADGIPVSDPYGVPRCSICGQIMVIKK